MKDLNKHERINTEEKGASAWMRGGRGGGDIKVKVWGGIGL